jgi:predicted aldo/keto reductase-like oxidoreductase
MQAAGGYPSSIWLLFGIWDIWDFGWDIWDKERVMLHRKLGRTGLDVSAIGLGCAQLGSSDADYAVRVVRQALDLGVTYVDLARGYRDAELKVGLAIRDVDRGKLVISTKTARRTREEAWREINESLERVGVDYFDNVHLHALDSGEEIDKRLGPGGAMEALLEAREQGLVHHIGCSGHHPEVLVEAVQRFPFEVILCSLNLVERVALDELVPLCLRRGVAVTVMKPLATGLLPAPIALKWLLHDPVSLPIACVVPGATTIEEAAENALVGHADLALSAEERVWVRALQAEWAHKRCRICHRCEPCPAGVPIGLTLGTDLMYDHYRTMGYETFRAFPWSRAAVEKDVASREKVMAAIKSCVHCEDCENKCPYGLPIAEMLQEQLGAMEQMMGVYQEVLGR